MEHWMQFHTGMLKIAYQLAARSVQSKALNLARLDSVAPKRQREKNPLVPRTKKNNHAQLN